MEGKGMKTLDVGCGLNKEPGAVGIDKIAAVNPDVLHDLEQFPYPFEDNTFDRILLRHVVEHHSDVVRLMAEIHRIATPNAQVEIVTPHYSASGSWTDPTHKQHLGYLSFDFFCGTDRHIGYYTERRFRMERKRLDFNRCFRLLGIQWLANRMPRFWEKCCCYVIRGRDMSFALRVVK